MKRISKVILSVLFPLFLILASADTLKAQNAGNGKVPPFGMLQSNGKVFRAQNLPFGKPIVLIYFSPECDHCEKLMKSLFARIKDFDKASIAMITFLPVEKVSKFVRDYNVGKYPNIFVGTEGTSFFVRNYYKIMDLPFVALYDKNGNLIELFANEPNVVNIAQKLKKLS